MGVSVPEEVIAAYSNTCEIIAQLTNNKMDNSQIICAISYLGKIIRGELPELVSYIPPEDIIRVQTKLMDKLSQNFMHLTSLRKLNDEEKILLAFCVYLKECEGIKSLTSVNAVMQKYERTKSIKPELFDNRDTINDENAEDYGYSPDNPIKAITIGDGYDFLDRLTVKGATVTYSRIGSVAGEQHIVDEYSVTVKSGTNKPMSYTLTRIQIQILQRRRNLFFCVKWKI
ncbi:MAG: hypothetical protein HFI90_04745 [Clostridia bacterium]|nr:hypothetical protein [Clostridia bacterium]